MQNPLTPVIFFLITSSVAVLFSIGINARVSSGYFLNKKEKEETE